LDLTWLTSDNSKFLYKVEFKLVSTRRISKINSLKVIAQ